MVKFSTWQMAFCLFSLCVFRGASDNNNAPTLNLNQAKDIISIINSLHSKVKATMDWRALRQSTNKDETNDRFNEYLKQVKKIQSIMESSDYSYQPESSIKKGGLQSIKDSTYSAGKSVSNKFASVIKYWQGSKKNFLNNELQSLFSMINWLRTEYIVKANQYRIRKIFIGDADFKEGIQSIKDKIDRIIKHKASWDKDIKDINIVETENVDPKIKNEE